MLALAVDRQTAHVVSAFDAQRIASVLLKGLRSHARSSGGR